MISIIFWTLAVLGCLYYGGYRIFKLYKTGSDNINYLTTGFMLIVYSTLIVGATGFLSRAVNEYHDSLIDVSTFWIAIDGFSSLLQYLAPFVFAAIGVNMISFAITNKQTNSNGTSEGTFIYQVDGLSDPSWPQKYNNPVNVGDHVSVDYAYKDTNCAARVTHVEHTSQGSHLIVESIEKELEKAN